jgi:hypothetical protein
LLFYWDTDVVDLTRDVSSSSGEVEGERRNDTWLSCDQLALLEAVVDCSSMCTRNQLLHFMQGKKDDGLKKKNLDMHVRFGAWAKAASKFGAALEPSFLLAYDHCVEKGFIRAVDMLNGYGYWLVYCT